MEHAWNMLAEYASDARTGAPGLTLESSYSMKRARLISFFEMKLFQTANHNKIRQSDSFVIPPSNALD